MQLDMQAVSLLQMKGKVTEWQYINQQFIAAMNKPIFELLFSMCSDPEQLIFCVLICGGNVIGIQVTG